MTPPGAAESARPELEQFAPRAQEFALLPAFCRQGRKPNSGNEPKKTPLPRTENSYAVESTTTEGEQHRLQHDTRDKEVNESLVALLDTACTSCIHSRLWRETYARSLPPNCFCEVTPVSKYFHFANGTSSDGKLQVWRIPIFLGGCRGEVHSAEVPTGSTPLLLSIPTMDALDMILHMRRREVEIRELGLSLPMVLTRTGHVAIRVDAGAAEGLWMKGADKEKPTIVSERGDLLVYFLEEAARPLYSCQAARSTPGLSHGSAPDLRPRGVRVEDLRGELPARRAEELSKVERHQQLLDRCMWTALRRDYTAAEQFVTNNFQNTVLYEPFPGNCDITRFGAATYAWTNSQPDHHLDGNDLWGRAGRSITGRVLKVHRPYLLVIVADSRLWRALRDQQRLAGYMAKQRRLVSLVLHLCRRQLVQGRHFLIEGPIGVAATAFDDIVRQLLDDGAGKLIQSDLCAYGLREDRSRTPTRSTTSWFSSAEALLNEIGRRCRCAGWVNCRPGCTVPGSYPKGFLQALCRGVTATMGIDYAVSFADGDLKHYEHAFPAEAEEETESAESEVPEEPAEDDWQVEDDRIIRIHRAPRRLLFLPLSTTAPPVPLARLTSQRRTRMLLNDGTRREQVDDWSSSRRQATDYLWTGETEFFLRPRPEQEPPQEGEQHRAGDPLWRAPAEQEPFESALPYDSAVPMESDDGGHLEPQPLRQEPPQEEQHREGDPQEGPLVLDQRVLRRRGHRVRQLQRGFWIETDEEVVLQLLQSTLDYVRQEGGEQWNKIDVNGELGKGWLALESAQADVKLILCSAAARRMKKPQPYFGPHEVPLRKSFLLLGNGQALTTDWETWANQSPAAQVRPLVAADRQLYLVLYGTEIGEEAGEDGAIDKFQVKEEGRLRQWQALPRELKLAVKRIHVNLGHASTQSMLRALRVSKASEVAIKAVRLFRCPECPRMAEPREPRPSKLPMTDEFNVQLGLDIFSEKDSKGETWTWLSVLCQGTTFQVCALLGDTHSNPTSQAVLEAFLSHWTSWAGYPERGVMSDRAKYFLAEFADEISDHGCTFDTAAKASPWQIGQVERHGGIWKESFRRLAWSMQVAGRSEVLLATSAVTQAKNAGSRKGGFTPTQWVLGRDIRLPAALCDDEEISRIGAQALAATPGTKFYRKTQLRMGAREAFARASNSDALRRAELRQVRPSRGPFPAGSFVFYYDAADKSPGPNCWRGIAKVVGREGSHTIWLSHRGILIAASPEQISRAFDEEAEAWTIVGNETSLMDPLPSSGGTGFIDLRKAPRPPAEPEGESGPNNNREEEQDLERAREALRQKREAGDLSSTSAEALRYESERDAKKARLSSEFFRSKERARKRDNREPESIVDETRGAEETPVPGADLEDLDLLDYSPSLPDWSPDVNDYHQHVPENALPPIAEEGGSEAVEREAKRQRVINEEAAHYVKERVSADRATESSRYLTDVAKDQYFKKEKAYLSAGVGLKQFLFGVRRNDFTEKYQALAVGSENGGSKSTKKKGRKEISLHELTPEQTSEFTKDGGSDEKEWKAWLSKEACEVLDLKTSLQVRKEKADLVIPTRWVRRNKHDGLVDQPFLAKSRLVVQGFKDKALGQYRRDAPTASAVAESLCLAVCVHYKFVLLAKDIKNAYFSGKSVNREIYLDQPKGGLPGLRPGQLLRARKAIYGFAEAARLFWLALKEHLESDGWVESRLEPALFYLRRAGELKGILVTHVDDIEGGVQASYMDKAFYNSAKALEFATNHFKDFIFRGREVRQTEEGHVDISMRNYALSMKVVQISRERKRELAAPLEDHEMEQYQSVAGELGWITRQLRCDLAYENGVAQRAKTGATVADLVRLKQYVGLARRGADFRQRFWGEVDLANGVIVHLADSGHANGTPDHNEDMKYRSVGGYFILVAEPGILRGETVKANILAFNSGMTKRVCRSTLAAEASHLAEAVEAGDWITVLLEEALTGQLDLKNWPELLARREKVYVTDARSVYDYLAKDANSTSSDKRMAIEGALLREAVRRPHSHIRWIDGMQNIADVLTKALADKNILRQFLRDDLLSLVQTPENQRLKEKKRAERQGRKAALKETGIKEAQNAARVQQAVKEAENILKEEEESG